MGTAKAATNKIREAGGAGAGGAGAAAAAGSASTSWTGAAAVMTGAAAAQAVASSPHRELPQLRPRWLAGSCPGCFKSMRK